MWSTDRHKSDYLDSPRTPKLVLVLFLCLLSGILPSACRRETGEKEPITQEEDVIAVVNNKKITLAVFQKRLSAFLKQYGHLVISGEQQLSQIKEIVIAQLIQEELINQEGSRKGIRLTGTEMDETLREALTVNWEENLKSHLIDRPLSEEEWLSRFRQYLIQKKLIQQEVIDKIPITKREISSYYESHPNDFIQPLAFRVSNITLATQAEATAILSKLQRGVDFKSLVREHSIAPDKIADGDLGYVERGDLPLEMESELFPSAARQSERRLTDIIRSQDGYHILKVEEYRRKKRLSLSEARPYIKKILVEQKWDRAYHKWLEKLKEDASISIDRTMLTREEGF